MSTAGSRLSVLVGVGASIAVHGAAAVWLALAPHAPGVEIRNEGSGDWSGVELSLLAPAEQAPEPPKVTERKPVEAPPPEPKPLPLPEPPLAQVTPPPPPPPPPMIDLDDKVLGVDESTAPVDSKSFLESHAEGENAAPMSVVEQPALTPEPGVPGPVAPPTNAETNPLTADLNAARPSAASPGSSSPLPAEPKPAEPLTAEPNDRAAPNESSTTPPPTPPTPTPSETPTDQPPAEALPLPPGEAKPEVKGTTTGSPDVAPREGEASKANEGTPTGDDKPLAETIEIGIFGQAPLMLPGLGPLYLPMPLEVLPTSPPPAPQSAPAIKPAAESTPEKSSPSESTAATPPTPGGSNRSRPGELSTKESTAFTVKRMQDYKPGRTLAPEGIDVTTVDPEIAIVSSISGQLRNPVIELRFGPDGKVKSATFKDGQTSGRQDWDDPIMHAMHRWTIGGKKFKQLLAENPAREVVMTVRMLLTR